MAYLDPLSADLHPDLQNDFKVFEKILGFVPNSLLTMQRKPDIVRGFSALTKAVMDPSGEVHPGFKRILAHLSSRAAGCEYCEAHSLIAAGIHGIPEEKIEAIWEYKTSPLYSEAERAAMDFAFATGQVPNGVDQKIIENVKKYWSDNQIVEILGAISLYGFLNRWNDSMATTLEAPAKQMGDKVLARGGWSGGKHLP